MNDADHFLAKTVGSRETGMAGQCARKSNEN